MRRIATGGSPLSASLQCPNLDAFRAGSFPMPVIRILLVDDDDIYARRARTVWRPSEAILATDRLRPDLIILDLSIAVGRVTEMPLFGQSNHRLMPAQLDTHLRRAGI